MHSLKLKWHKITHWEYWPFSVVYFPILFVWVYYAIRARSIFYFNASNPLITNGGYLMESKKEIYDIIPQQYIPTTILCEPKSNIKDIEAQIKENALQYPFIAKPDIGMKGLAVMKVENLAQLQQYNNNIPIPYLLQSLITLPNELGIFYCKYPNAEKGFITGIVSKEFLTVTGNGQHTLLQLIEQNKRASFQKTVLQKQYGEKLFAILPKNEILQLVPFGNHSRGAKFVDHKKIITPKLEQTIEDICSKIPHFYFGRIDIKYNTIEELNEGKNFSIIELNGAGSEPAHIYDPKHSIFFAWKEIIKHQHILYKISVQNNQKGFPFLSFKNGVSMLKGNAALVKKLETFSI